MRVYTAAEVHAALPWPALAQALEQAFVQGAQVPLRHAHALSDTDRLLLMPAWDESLVVTKIVTVMPGAAATVQASVLALDRRSGAPLAMLDGDALTLRRTAATSALAAHHLAAELAAEGLPARAAPELQAAVARAHIVCCATTSTEPLVRGEWLAPGTHLDLVGGFRPDMREVDDAAVARARIVADTYAGALAEAGDLVQPLARGVIRRDQVVAELAELLRGRVEGRRDAAEITLFKSVGTALEDLAAARCVLAAAATGIGLAR